MLSFSGHETLAAASHAARGVLLCAVALVLDFVVEGGLVVSTALLITFRVSPSKRGKRWLMAAVVLIFGMQMAFNRASDW